MLRNLRNSAGVKPSVSAVMMDRSVYQSRASIQSTALSMPRKLWTSAELLWHPDPEHCSQLFGSIDNYVGRFAVQRVRGETIGYANGPQPGIASRTHIHMRIAYNRRLLRLDAAF